jgi:hypothetical protein
MGRTLQYADKTGNRPRGRGCWSLGSHLGRRPGRPRVLVQTDWGAQVALNLKSYEQQAKFSVVLAALSALAALGVIFLLLKNFKPAHFYVTYNPQGLWLPVLAAGLAFGLLVGAAGFFMALNSAGQRRNKLSRLAWQAFFLNALVITVMLCAAVFFYFTRFPMTPRGG